MSEFSYKDIADIVFYDLDIELFESIFGKGTKIKSISMNDLNCSSDDIYNCKIEDIIPIERSKKWIKGGILNNIL